jgi:hypothetical protein
VKNLQYHVFDPVKCRAEWRDFTKLLTTKTVLSELNDVLPFFKVRHDLSLLICTYFTTITNADVFAHEYDIDGVFTADLIVGDSNLKHYVLVEFEDGRPNSIFRKKKNKSTPVWAERLEGAYSQLVDWLWKLEDNRSTANFVDTFGARDATFQGLIIAGKDMNLAAREKSRLKWRENHTAIASNRVSVRSFNDIHKDFDYWLKTYHRA